jgi:predicted phage baseplate assembly protein
VEPPPPEAVIPAIFEAALEDQPPQVSWEYSSGQGWSRLGVIDETNAFDGRGLIRFVGPKGLAARHLFGQELYWLRVRWREGHFPVSPRLRRLLTNTTWARQAVTIRDEIVGSSDGNPGQRWPLAQQNILTGETIAIREPDMPPAEEIAPEQVTLVLDAAGDVTEIWVRWQEVADFHGSGPRDRHYVLDRITGTVLFGDGRHGMMPPTGQNNIRASYRSGGGERGNRAAGTIIQLKSSVAYVDSVTNVEAASGGAERQSLDSVRRYGPRALRHRYRAVTAVDLEDLAFAASAQVARAKAIPPRFSPLDLWLTPGEMPTDLAQHRDVREAGVMGLIIVPQSDSPRPVPSLELVEQVREYLVARSAATADVWVAGPEWIEVSVTAVIVPTSLEAADFVGEAVKTALARFLHPLTGGAEGKGWAFGRKPYRSDLFALIEGVAGVEYVRSLAVAESPDTATISRLERRLIFSGQHEIVISV